MTIQIYKELIKQGASSGDSIIRSPLTDISQDYVSEIFKSGSTTSSYDFFQRIPSSIGSAVQREIVKPETWEGILPPSIISVNYNNLAANGSASVTTT